MQLKKHKTLHNLHMYINTKEAPVSCHINYCLQTTSITKKHICQ